MSTETTQTVPTLVHQMEEAAKATGSSALHREAKALRQRHTTAVGTVSVMRHAGQWYQKIDGAWVGIDSIHDLVLDEKEVGHDDSPEH